MPSGRGAPTAPGLFAGSKASLLRAVLAAAPASGARDGRGGRGGGVGAGAAEAELDVLLEALELVLEPTLLILQFLDAAVGLPQFVLQPVDAQVERAGVASVDRVGRPAGNVGGGKRGLRSLLRRVAVERVEIECARARRAEETHASKNRAGAAKARKQRQDVKPLSVARRRSPGWRANSDSIGSGRPKVRRRFGRRAARSRFPVSFPRRRQAR